MYKLDHLIYSDTFSNITSFNNVQLFIFPPVYDTYYCSLPVYNNNLNGIIVYDSFAFPQLCLSYGYPNYVSRNMIDYFKSLGAIGFLDPTSYHNPLRKFRLDFSPRVYDNQFVGMSYYRPLFHDFYNNILNDLSHNISSYANITISANPFDNVLTDDLYYKFLLCMILPFLTLGLLFYKSYHSNVKNLLHFYGCNMTHHHWINSHKHWTNLQKIQKLFK